MLLYLHALVLTRRTLLVRSLPVLSTIQLLFLSHPQLFSLRIIQLAIRVFFLPKGFPKRVSLWRILLIRVLLALLAVLVVVIVESLSLLKPVHTVVFQLQISLLKRLAGSESYLHAMPASKGVSHAGLKVSALARSLLPSGLPQLVATRCEGQQPFRGFVSADCTLLLLLPTVVLVLQFLVIDFAQRYFLSLRQHLTHRSFLQ